MTKRPGKPTIARDLNDIFRDGELDLDAVEDAEVPRLPLADAEDMWLAEIARRPAHLDVTKIGDRHLGLHGKLLLAAVIGLHRAGLPVDRETLAGEVASSTAREAWASWGKRDNMPSLEPRSLLKRLRMPPEATNLTFAEDCLIRSYSETKYGEALMRASEIARDRGMGEAQSFMREVESRIEAAASGVSWQRAGDIGRAFIQELRAKLSSDDATWLTTFSPRLDQFTKGWYRRRMTSIGGWPGHGKSTLMLQLMVAIGMSGRDVAYISLEDEATIPVLRIVMQQLRDLDAARRVASLSPRRPGHDGFTDGDVLILEDFAKRVLDEMPLHITDKGPWSKDKVSAAIASAGRSGCKIAFVDYLQCVKSEGDDLTPHYNRCVTEWKESAKAVGIHLVLGTQLRRARSDEDAPRPRVDMAAYCPGIEQASEYVVLTHRHEKDKPVTGKGDRAGAEAARILMVKGKDAGLGEISLHWCNDRQMFIHP